MDASSKERPVSWRETFAQHSDDIDQRIVSAYSRGASNDEAWSDLRSYAQGSLGATPEDCGPGSEFDSACRAMFEEHLERLENSGLLKRSAQGYVPAQSADYEGAGQPGAAAGGAGPRGEGLSAESTNPDQWGKAGQATNKDGADYFRQGEQRDVRTGEDEWRHTEEF
jgi:hypothetical protein